MKKFDQFINEAEMAGSDLNLFKRDTYKEQDLEYLSIKEIGKQGKLAEYIDEGHTLKFGILKALYHDAIEYKKKREYEKGLAKFAMRIIPIALAPVFFPVWLASQILGATRAFDKIIIPALQVNNNYKQFLKSMVVKTMNLAEGDIKPFLGKDWYYDVFYVHDGLTKMVKEKYIFEFATFITEKIQNKPDDEEVPHYWLDDEFRKWLNGKFNLDLHTGERLVRHFNIS